jgi:hypothetical protein
MGMRTIFPRRNDIDIFMTNKQDPFQPVSEDEEIVAPLPLKKEAKEAKKVEPPKIKPKLYYEVKVECMLPATLTYRVLAEDAFQAAEMIKGKSPNSVAHKLIGRKELVLKVYDSGSSMMRFMKKLLG